MSTAASLLTAEEYAELPDCGSPTDLIQGQVLVMPPPFPRHGEICAQIVYLLRRFLEDSALGRVISNDSGVITERDPDTVRGADVAYYSYDRVPKGPMGDKLLAVPPELVFEVLSPTDRWGDVHAKVSEYLAAGVIAVCVVDDASRSVQVFHPERPAQVLAAGEELSLPQILGEFHVRVGRFFE